MDGIWELSCADEIPSNMHTTTRIMRPRPVHRLRPDSPTDRMPPAA